MIKYIKNSIDELKNKVTWTDRSEAQRLVLVVAGFSIVFSLAVWGVDTLLDGLVAQYFRLIK